jgi:hypothetical protein
MCTRPTEDHPIDVLRHIAAKLAFIGDAFSQHSENQFQLSVQGEFGLFLILRGLEDEVMAVSDQLHEAEEVKS